MQGQLFMTPKAVCEALQCGRSTLTYWRKTKPDFPKPVMFGERSPRYAVQEIEAYVQARRNAAQSEQ